MVILGRGENPVLRLRERSARIDSQRSFEIRGGIDIDERRGRSDARPPLFRDVVHAEMLQQISHGPVAFLKQRARDLACARGIGSRQWLIAISHDGNGGVCLLEFGGDVGEKLGADERQVACQQNDRPKAFTRSQRLGPHDEGTERAFHRIGYRLKPRPGLGAHDEDRPSNDRKGTPRPSGERHAVEVEGRLITAHARRATTGEEKTVHAGHVGMVTGRRTVADGRVDTLSAPG